LTGTSISESDIIILNDAFSPEFTVLITICPHLSNIETAVFTISQFDASNTIIALPSSSSSSMVSEFFLGKIYPLNFSWLSTRRVKRSTVSFASTSSPVVATTPLFCNF